MQTYTVHVDDTTVDCEMDPIHFRFLTGYMDKHIYPVDVTMADVENGMKLYPLFQPFREITNKIYKFTTKPTLRDIQKVCVDIFDILNNKFFKWLSLDITDDEIEIIWRGSGYLVEHDKITDIYDIIGTRGRISEYEFQPNTDSIVDYYFSNINPYELLERCCQRNHIKAAKWLTLDGTTLNYIRKDPFWWTNTTVFLEMACINGALDVAQLLSKCTRRNEDGKLPLTSSALPTVSNRGHIDMLQWLFSLHPTDVLFTLEQVQNAFEVACGCGRLKVAQWLLTQEATFGTFDIHANNDALINNVCRYTNTTMAQWVLSLESTHGPFQIDFDKLADDAEKSMNDAVAVWLRSLKRST